MRTVTENITSVKVSEAEGSKDSALASGGCCGGQCNKGKVSRVPLGNSRTLDF